MAGVNKVLKAGQVVFKAGDAADGMYIVRKGELVVYLEQAGQEVVLAKVPEGGMIGEMALFDRQPRSASVKAVADCEVTLVSVNDFTNLMKQIPKWFVGLMSALSGRLRTTNERLKQIEATANAAKNGGVAPAENISGVPQKPFQSVIRMLHVLELLWHRDGVKDGKEWCLNRKIAFDALVNIFGETNARVDALLDLLAQEQILTTKLDQYKSPLLVLANRGALRQFTEFTQSFIKLNPNLRAIPQVNMQILKVLQKIGNKAPYEQYTCSYEDIIEEAKAMGIVPNEWDSAIKVMGSYGEAIKLAKTTAKSGFGLKIEKAAFGSLVKDLNAFNRISAASLDS